MLVRSRLRTQEQEDGLHPPHPFNILSLCVHCFFSLSLNRLEKGFIFKTTDLDAMDFGYCFYAPSFQAQLVVTFPTTIVLGVTCLAAPLS